MSNLPIAIYYEQPNWFKPLFAELDRRDPVELVVDERRELVQRGRVTRVPGAQEARHGPRLAHATKNTTQTRL